MTDKLRVREELNRLLPETDFEPAVKFALKEWFNGKPKLLKEQYPILYQQFHQSVKFQTALVKYNSDTEIEMRNRVIEDLEVTVQPAILAEDNPSTLDREYDIVYDYDLLLKLEMLPRNSEILGPDRKLIHSRKLANKQCLVGFILVMFRNGIYKKSFSLKKGKNKIVVVKDVMVYSQDRYDFGSMEAARKYLDHCVELALTRMPGLKLFDDNNYQKQQQLKKQQLTNQLSFKKPNP